MKKTKIILIIAVIVFAGIESFAQVDLRRVRDKGSERTRDSRNRQTEQNAEPQKETNESKTAQSYDTYAIGDCERYKDRIEQRMERLENMTKDGNTGTFNQNLLQAKTEIEKFRTDCPNEAAKYADNIEQRVNAYETWYNNHLQEQEIAAETEEELEARVDDIYWGVREITGYLNNRSWDVKGLQPFLEKDRVNAEKIATVEALVNSNPEYQTQRNNIGRRSKDILEFKPEMEEKYNSTVVSRINSQIEEAYNIKARGKSSFNDALEAAEIAINGAKFLLNIFPGNSEFIQLQRDAIDARTAILKKYGADIFTSEFHMENAGAIVFTTSPLSIKNENKSLIKNEFTPNDNIYATVYMKGAVAGVGGNRDDVYLEIYVNDDKKFDRRWHATKEEMNQSFYAIELLPDPASSKTQGAIEYAKMFSELSPRRHKIRIEFHSRYGDELGRGEFWLDLRSGREEIQKKATALQQKQVSSVSMPASKMRNADLESQMKSALSTWPGVVQRVVITDSDWQIHRNPITGIIEHRTISTTVAIKNDDGTCKKVWVSFRQDYANGSYGRTVQHGVGGTDAIACENVNK